MLSKEKIKPGSMIHLPDIDYMGDGEGKQKKNNARILRTASL